MRMCSSMHLAQKRCRHGDTTFTFFIVPQHTGSKVGLYDLDIIAFIGVVILALYFVLKTLLCGRK